MMDSKHGQKPNNPAATGNTNNQNLTSNAAGDALLAEMPGTHAPIDHRDAVIQWRKSLLMQQGPWEKLPESKV